MLVPGCGDAPFSVDAFNDGYRHQLGVDNSKAVIDMMAARTRGMDGLAWSCEDLCDMKSIDDGKFGAVGIWSAHRPPPLPNMAVVLDHCNEPPYAGACHRCSDRVGMVVVE